MAEINATTLEVWKPLPDYEERYSVSSLGRIRIEKSAQRSLVGHIMSLPINKNGYRHVGVSRNGKRKYAEVHRLIARTFLGACPPGQEVNHKNADKTDNRVENLEYCTRAENARHAQAHGLLECGERRWNAKLTEQKVRDMRTRHANDGVTGKQLAAEMNIAHTLACKVLRREMWKHVI